MRDHMLSARRLGLSLTTTLFFLALASPTAAQTTSVTLYGIVYPTNDVVFEDGLYTYGIPTYLWIGNDPQITILGTGADGQTTFGYYDIYTQSQNDVGLTTLITESGIMVQDSAGLYYDGTFAVETCKFALEATAGAAECVLPFFSPPFTVTGTITPFFTYIETLQTPPPTSTPTPSSANTSGTTQGSPTGTSSGPFPPKHKVPTGPIVGGILGGLAVIVGILAFLFWRRRQRHGDSMREKDEFDPEPAGASESPLSHISPPSCTARQSQTSGCPSESTPPARPRLRQ
ncbi:hypothetical protein DFH07DRAFT_499470 [Mycena maculata]|uniref:Uncharacterized protein n=1 Tax=Mycena maculata TaxID=230809 RepID=A0AAD7J1H6_9AGAR|nr:hypothetical protein DFH07DRAFT_499470 [Mycena maculata]